MVLTKNQSVWACGPNGGYAFLQYYYGVLGTGSNDYSLEQRTLVRVHDGVMDTESDHLENINNIDAGWMHSLALEKYDPCDPNLIGYVWSWGGNREGQLGVDDRTERLTPVQVLRGQQAPADPNNPDPNLARIIDISAGRSGEFSLAADANGYAYAWGMNQEGQLGNNKLGEDERELTPVFVLRGEQPQDPCNPSLYLKHIIAVSAGADHSMALEKLDPDDPNLNGCVYTWGNNRWPGDGENYQSGLGKLGKGGTADPCEPEPVRVLRGEQDYNEPNHVYLKYIVAISAGWNHCMALEEYDPFDPNLNGRVYTWGSNGQGWGDAENPRSLGGRLGDGTTTDRNTPILVLRGEQQPEDPCNPDPNLTRIVAVSAGEAHSMALDVDGYVYCWGDNQHGQLGDGTTDQSLVPVRVVGEDGEGYIENVVAIAAGYWHSIAVDANGTIWTWGKGSDGRLGLANKTIDCNTPHRIPVVYNITQETFQFAIQPAIDEANDVNDILEASVGTYYENVNFRNKSVTLRSAAPSDLDVVADTIVDGRYNQGDDRYNYAVNFNDGSGSSLAGFTLTEAIKGGIICESLSSAYVTNCVIRDNSYDGMYLNSSSVDITSCIIQNNGQSSDFEFYGIYCWNSPYPDIINISRCIIEDNNDGGIYCDGAATTTINITNNWIYDNGAGGGGSGIYLYSGDDVELEDVLIRHNTIANNAGYGIGTDGNGIPDINNCIIWGNDSGSLGDTNYNVTYSCIEDGYTGTGNISSDPCFMDADANDFHLAANSPCIDTGDPDFEPDANETDIDGEERVIDGRVDMGADEFYWSEADYSGDGIINFVDYAMLTSYWEESEIDYNDVFGRGDSNSVSLDVFCDEWLWQAGWVTGPMPLMAGRGGEGMAKGLGLEFAPYELVTAEPEPVIAEPVDIKKMLAWLAEIWLDPEVREGIGAENWLKLYESLEKELENQ